MRLQPWLWAALVALPLSSSQSVDGCGESESDVSPTPPVYDLGDAVQISLDTSGVPHIRGNTLPDLAFAQGYATARDRLWQMDLLRRRARGQLAEIFGESRFDSDHFMRALQLGHYANLASARLDVEAPEAAQLLDAYAAGVNTYLDAAVAGKDGASLPPQIVAAGYVPAPWFPEDSLVIDKLVSYDASARHLEELTHWLMGRLLGASVAADLLRPAPIERAFIVPGYYDGQSSGSGDDATVLPGVGATGSFSRGELLAAVDQSRSLELGSGLLGASTWAISGELTREGAPLLAHDAQLRIAQPGTFYDVHLTADGTGSPLDVLGESVPGIPLVFMGHNAQVAWGVSLNRADLSDLYLETVVGDSVSFNNKLVPIESRSETILVRPEGGSVADCERRSVTLKRVPHHGPVLPPDIIGLNATISAAWVGWDDSSLLPALAELARSEDGAQVRDALTRLGSVALDVVYADIHGEIGYASEAPVPVREVVDPENPPYMVLPGSGGYEWTESRVPSAYLPRAINPAQGLIVAADNDPAGLVDDNNPFNGPYLEEFQMPLYLGAAYDPGLRAYRVQTLVSAAAPAKDITLDDLAGWQGDVQSRLAIRLLPYLFDAAARRAELLSSSSRSVLQELQRFHDAGAFVTTDSIGALQFHAWLAYALQAVFADEADAQLLSTLDPATIDRFARPLVYFLDATAQSIDALDFQAAGGCRQAPTDPRCSVSFPSSSGKNYFDNILTSGYVETRDEVLLDALSRASSRLIEIFGSLQLSAWGDVHTMTFEDEIALLSDGAPTLGPFAADGGLFTVDAADGTLMTGGQLSPEVAAERAPAQRAVVELSPGGVRSWRVLAIGQSERSSSKHFKDQLEPYLDNLVRQIPFEESDVSAATSAMILLPAGYPATGTPILSGI